MKKLTLVYHYVNNFHSLIIDKLDTNSITQYTHLSSEKSYLLVFSLLLSLGSCLQLQLHLMISQLHYEDTDKTINCSG